MSLHQDVEHIIVGFQDGQRFRWDIEEGTKVLEIFNDLGVGDRTIEYRATLADGRAVVIPAHAMVSIVYRQRATPWGTNPE